MKDQKGGAIIGILAAIGLVVVLMALFLGGCFANAGATGYRPSVTRYHDGRDGNSGGEQGNGNDQKRCHESRGDCRGSFSPGPFDRSPVEIHDNDVCISPNCSGRSDEPTTTTTGERQR